LAKYFSHPKEKDRVPSNILEEGEPYLYLILYRIKNEASNFMGGVVIPTIAS